MKKKFVIFLCFTLLANILHSQNIDGGATEILQTLSKKYQQFTTIKIDYTYTVEKEKKVIDSQQGNITIKGNKYVLELKSQLIYCDGNTIWNYDKNAEEITIFDYDPSDDVSMLHPLTMLKNWQKEYTAKFIREEVQQNKTLQIIDLQPIRNISYYKIRLYIDKHKKELYASSIFEKDNTIYSYFIDKFVISKIYEDTFFILDTSQYPNAEINDMR